jgi:hypothetical protein
MTKLIVICQILAVPSADWRTNAPTWSYQDTQCHSEIAGVVPEAIEASDEVTKSLNKRIDELVKKMEAER